MQEHVRLIYDCCIFAYLSTTSEPLVDLLESDLLSPDSAQALCASRPFLLGMAASLLQMCSGPLSTRLESSGRDAFDYHYFLKDLVKEQSASKGADQKIGISVAFKERCLIEGTHSSDMKSKTITDHENQSRFAGATEFFFLAAALLRISLFPGFRVAEEFQSQFRNVFSAIQQTASQQLSEEQLRGLRRETIEQFQKCVSVAQGWTVFVDDPDTSSLITAFCLMQLEWVALVATDSAALCHVPEWFVKLPAQWLARKYCCFLCLFIVPTISVN